jgi:hypothetical protein
MPVLFFMQEVQRVQSPEQQQVIRHSLFVSVLVSTYAHHLLECLGITYYHLMVVPRLCIPRHGVCKDWPDCGHEHPSLVSKITCIHDRQMVEESLSMCELRAPLSLSSFAHHLAQPEHLGIAWLLHYSSLAACAETWLPQELA